MLGKSYEWTVEKLGQPSYPSDWTTSRSKSDRGEKQITFGIRHFQVKDSSTPSGTRTLQVSFLGVENGPKLIRSLQWNDLKPQGFDAAFDTNKLTLTDFEFVKETSIAHGWDVTTLRHKDKKHVHLELTRTESSYRIKLSVEAGLEFFEKEKAAPSPL